MPQAGENAARRCAKFSQYWPAFNIGNENFEVCCLEFNIVVTRGSQFAANQRQLVEKNYNFLVNMPAGLRICARRLGVQN